jgi:hypothetical protein
MNPGDLLPHFEGATINGRETPYKELWQHRNLVLLVLPAEAVTRGMPYLRALENRLAELKPPDASLLISRRPIGDVETHSLVIADRWGEIVHLVRLTPDPAAWPSIDDIIAWMEFIGAKCPECPP